MKSKIISQVKKAKDASYSLANASSKLKDRALKFVAAELIKNKKKIISANRKDLSNAEKVKLSGALLKRLNFQDTKIMDSVAGIKSLIKLADPVGATDEAMELDKGLILYKVKVPIGVIGVIFESRPDALVQIASLCIKSGNSVILKGGSEASNTNRILAEIIRSALRKAKLSAESVQLIETREDVSAVLGLDKHVDLLIPRGSNSFVSYIMDNTKIPVLGHAAGICHVYVDKDADLKKAVNISFDSKCQYAAVCNAMETLLVHKDVARKFLPMVLDLYRKAGVEIRGCARTISLFKHVKRASDKDWETEYNDLVLSIRIVDDLSEAIRHINRYGSGHTDSIVTENRKVAEKFMGLVDSSSVMWNASTRFSDGFRYGKGAEVGISTNKIHARGPVGLEGLVIYKYKLIGNGQVVSDYSGGKKKFSHKRLR